MPKRVLVVDDDPAQRRILEETIKRFGYSVATAESGEKALAALKADTANDICLVLLDLVMPGTDGMAVLGAMRSLPKKPPAIVQTAHGSIDAAIAAMRAGAVDFVVKPVSPERLEVSIKNALKIEALAGELNRIKAQAKGSLGFADLIAGSEAMKRVIELGKRAANSTIPVLIEGELGVGKELIARAIQGESARAGKPFVTVNCGAIPENLVESILFGHEKGSFTGASEKRAGKFVEADQGTLFLDEIGELPLDAQVKLLRALQEGEIDPVGGKQPVKVDFRLISATNQNLISLVNEGRFREDLYYRMNVFPIWVPPLRERLEDVPELIRHFIARFAAEEGKQHRRHRRRRERHAPELYLAGQYPPARECRVQGGRACRHADADGERVPADRRACRGLSGDGAAGAGAQGSGSPLRWPGDAGRVGRSAHDHPRALCQRQGRDRHPGLERLRATSARSKPSRPT